MAYKYEDEIKEELEFIRFEFIGNQNEMLKELKEIYRKARAYDLLREDIEINEKVFKQQAENDEVSAIIHGHYLALLEQSELEDKHND